MTCVILHTFRESVFAFHRSKTKVCLKDYPRAATTPVPWKIDLEHFLGFETFSRESVM